MSTTFLKANHDHTNIDFPDGFLWGAATSAFQVEGDTKFSDWWEWEQEYQPIEKRSGLSANQYNLYEQDFDLAKSLGHNAHRLSLEWSRIEPIEGEFNPYEIDHYKKVLKALKDRGMVVMLTLHHFSNPAWFAKSGGWVSSKAPFYFERFIKRIVPDIKDYVDLWVTINEPSGYAYSAYWTKEFPPQKQNRWLLFKTLWHMAQAHKKAYTYIHQVVPEAKVGIANIVTSFNAFHHHSLTENVAVMFADIISNHLFYFLSGKKNHDFLGLNYYFNLHYSLIKEGKVPNLVDITKTQKDVSDLGWEIYPEGMFDILVDFSDYNLPIYITENGIATTNDDRRVRFLISYLKEIYHAMQYGIDIKGYFHWSLIDNMELHRGFTPRFGLIEVDYNTQKRTPRPSAYVYKEIIKNNAIPHKLLKLLGHGIKVEDVIKI